MIVFRLLLLVLSFIRSEFTDLINRLGSRNSIFGSPEVESLVILVLLG